MTFRKIFQTFGLGSNVGEYTLRSKIHRITKFVFSSQETGCPFGAVS